MTTLPEITQEPIQHVDATPDEEYPLRILKAYRQNCDARWVSTEPNVLIDMMNKHCERRAEILDKAIAVLELNLNPSTFSATIIPFDPDTVLGEKIEFP
jgi:hypothetical protein